MSYEPRGKVKTLVDAMRASALAVWPAADVAKVMDIPQANIPAYLGACIKHGMVYRQLESGKSFFSLQPCEQEAQPPAAPAAPAPLQIPTFRKPGEWRPPVMTPPRGSSQRIESRETIFPEWPPAATPAPTPAPAPAMAAPPPATQAPSVPEPGPVAEKESEEQAVETEFNAALWADGDLCLYGLEELEDGSGYKLAAEHVPALKRLLAGVQA